MPKIDAWAEVKGTTCVPSELAAQLPSILPDLGLSIKAGFYYNYDISPATAGTQLVKLLLDQQLATDLERTWREELSEWRDSFLAGEIHQWEDSGERLKNGVFAFHRPRSGSKSDRPPTRRQLRKAADVWHDEALRKVLSGSKPPSWHETVHSSLPAPPPAQLPYAALHSARAESVSSIPPLVLLLSLPVSAWLTGLASEAGKDTWQWIRRGVGKLFKARIPRPENTSNDQSVDRLVIKDTKTGIEIVLYPTLPDEAWQQLVDIQLPPAPRGVADCLIWQGGRWQMGIRICDLPLDGPYATSDQQAQITWDPGKHRWNLERVTKP